MSWGTWGLPNIHSSFVLAIEAGRLCADRWVTWQKSLSLCWWIASNFKPDINSDFLGTSRDSTHSPAVAQRTCAVPLCTAHGSDLPAYLSGCSFQQWLLHSPLKPGLKQATPYLPRCIFSNLDRVNECAWPSARCLPMSPPSSTIIHTFTPTYIHSLTHETPAQPI